MIIRKIAVIYFALLATFTLFIILTFTIPTSGIKDNLIKSVEQINEEGLWYKPMGIYLFQIDNMTDCIMMDINACADSENPVRSAMITNYVLPDEDNSTPAYENITGKTLDILINGQKKSDNINNYARYWHGYQVILRPLFLFFNYNQIRILNYIIFTLLAAISIVMLYKVLGSGYALTFLAALVLSNTMIVPLAIQFSTCFYISIIAMLIFLTRPKFAHDTEKSIIIFFITGAVTSYMDFLTTPILTLGFPLIVAAAISAGSRNMAKNIAMQSISWFGGYALLWSSKWMMAWILTGENVVDSAIGSARLRMGNTIVFGGSEMTMNEFFDIITTKISSIINPLWILFIIFVLIIIATTYIYINRQRMSNERWLFMIAIMPLLWFTIMKNHSLQHIFFTWRDWILTLWCIMIFMCNNKKKTHSNNENRSPDTLL